MSKIRKYWLFIASFLFFLSFLSYYNSLFKQDYSSLTENFQSDFHKQEDLLDSFLKSKSNIFLKKDVNKIRETFNAIRNIEYNIKDVVDIIQQGGRAHLGNNIELVRKKHQGIYEILIEKVNERKERDRLQKAGASFKIRENLTMSGEFYIPFHTAEITIENILEVYNTKIILQKKHWLLALIIQIFIKGISVICQHLKVI